MFSAIWNKYKAGGRGGRAWYYAYNKDEGEDVVVQQPLPKYQVPPSVDELQRTTCFTRAEIKKLHRSFKDSFPNGLATEAQFEALFARHLKTKANSKKFVKILFKKLDYDNDGDVSFEDFIRSYSIICNGPSDELFDWLFGLYDLNGDQYITFNEFRILFESLLEIRGCKSKWSKDTILIRAQHLAKLFGAEQDITISKEKFKAACWKNTLLCENIEIPVNRGKKWDTFEFTYPEEGCSQRSSSMDSQDSSGHSNLSNRQFIED